MYKRQILAVVFIYFDKLNPFKPDKTPRQVQKTWQLWAKVVVASLPAVIIGIPLDNWFEKNFHNFVSVAIMLIIYGVASVSYTHLQNDYPPFCVFLVGR